MELQGERFIPATVDHTWAALNDPEVLKACIAGCESVDRTAEDAFTAVVALKVGPVSARFKGNLKLTNVTPPDGYTIHFDGQGGIAGFGKGSADVALVPEGGGTKLSYHARASVGGKMAQIGSRLIDATASKLTEDFFKAFEAKVTALHPAAALPASAAGVPTAASATAKTAVPASAAEATAAMPASAAKATTAVATSAAEATTADGPPTAVVPTAESNADVKKLGLLIGAVIVLAGLYVLLQK